MMDDGYLPSLPEPPNYESAHDEAPLTDHYSAAQMKQYAREAILAERERCAKLAESFATCPCNGERGRCMENDSPLAIAAAIRKA